MNTYLNIIYVGPNVYGVEMGAKYYFDKSASDLDLAECAFLAGLNHSPNTYNPFGDKDNVLIFIPSDVREHFLRLKKRMFEAFPHLLQYVCVQCGLCGHCRHTRNRHIHSHKEEYMTARSDTPSADQDKNSSYGQIYIFD